MLVLWPGAYVHKHAAIATRGACDTCPDLDHELPASLSVFIVLPFNWPLSVSIQAFQFVSIHIAVSLSVGLYSCPSALHATVLSCSQTSCSTMKSLC